MQVLNPYLSNAIQEAPLRGGRGEGEREGDRVCVGVEEYVWVERGEEKKNNRSINSFKEVGERKKTKV